MQDNPYQVLAQSIRDTAKGQVPLTACTGVVASSSPLTVQAAGLILTAEDLLINSALLPCTLRVAGAELSGALVMDGAESDVTSGTLTGQITVPGESLFPGDRVALLYAGEAEDRFILLCKAVAL